jgi:hypothetical protein
VTHNHNLLSPLRLTPGNGYPFCHPLGLA